MTTDGEESLFFAEYTQNTLGKVFDTPEKKHLAKIRRGEFCQVCVAEWKPSPRWIMAFAENFDHPAEIIFPVVARVLFKHAEYAGHSADSVISASGFDKQCPSGVYVHGS